MDLMKKHSKGYVQICLKEALNSERNYYSLTITSKKIALGFNIFGKLNAQIECMNVTDV